MTQMLIKMFIKNPNDVNDPKTREKYGFLGSIVGICCNVILSLIKLFAGIISSSIAITADAMNNLSDAGSSVVAMVGFKMAGRPADDDHPFGHGRAEYVSGLVVSMIIIIVGFELGRGAVMKIITPEPMQFSLMPLIILIISVFVKLWMCLFNRKLGSLIQSETLRATAMDSLGDVIATAAVIVSMVINYLTSVNVDAYAGVVVAVFIIVTGFNTARDTLNPLLGQAPDAEFVRKIEKFVLSNDHIMGIHDMVVHNYGPNRSVISLHAEVPKDGNILEIHDTIDVIEREIKKQFNCDAVIHMDPISTDDAVTNAMLERITALIHLIDSTLAIHDFRMVEGTTHTNLIFDIVIPHKFRLSDDDVVESIRSAVKTLDPTFDVVINVDKAFVLK